MFDMIKDDAKVEIINFGYSGCTVSHKGVPYIGKATYK